MTVDYFDIKNTFFAVCGTKIMSVALNVNDLFIQAVVTVFLAILGATANHFWKKHVLDRSDGKKSK